MLVPPGNPAGWFVFYTFGIMRNILAVLVFLGSLASCTHPDAKLLEKISNADSVAINYFKGDGTMDSVLKVKIVRDTLTIGKLSSLVAAKAIDLRNDCGLDGSIHYFKNNVVVQDINFRMNADKCNQFSYKLNGKYGATELSAAAKQLLLSLQ